MLLESVLSWPVTLQNSELNKASSLRLLLTLVSFRLPRTTMFMLDYRLLYQNTTLIRTCTQLRNGFAVPPNNKQMAGEWAGEWLRQGLGLTSQREGEKEEVREKHR